MEIQDILTSLLESHSLVSWDFLYTVSKGVLELSPSDSLSYLTGLTNILGQSVTMPDNTHRDYQKTASDRV